MSTIVPTRLLFDFEFPLAHLPTTPTIDGAMSNWTDAHRLPVLGSLDGLDDFADVWGGWNQEGMCFACRVEGKRRPLQCKPVEFWRGDNVRLCIDTRDARSNKRGTRYCRQFYLLPNSGPRGDAPIAGANPIKRAKEEAPAIDTGRIRIASKVSKTGYALELHIPAVCLTGYDPADHPRIGFYYIIEDLELGQQYLTVGDEYQWHIDPSTWATAVLTS